MSMQLKHPKLFIQMSGAPGSGKSTIARLLGQSIGGVVIDHDVLRSSLLGNSLQFSEAAKNAYELQWALALDVMKQGLSVIIDSTCNFQVVLDRGSELAKIQGYQYWYVECQVRDVDLLDRRLRSRVPMTSQRTGADCAPAAAVVNGIGENEDARATFKRWIENPCRPKGNNIIIVDSIGNPEMLGDHILRMIAN
jgi:predicted kinase